MDPNPIRVTTPMGTTSRPDGEPTVPYPGDGRWGGLQAQAHAQAQIQQAQAQAQGAAQAQMLEQQQQSQQGPPQPQHQHQRVPSVTSIGSNSGLQSQTQPQQPQHYGGYLSEQQHIQQQQQQQQQQEPQSPQQQQQTSQPFNGNGAMSELHAAANGGRPPIMSEQQRRQGGGPVEFNHAINYVNKIKNRFSSQPEIYKNFLEILQTYQREQLRITEVYTQVTSLFKDAPDLLEDFKQFLPDTSQPQGQIVGQEAMRLPPVGNFAPPGSIPAGTVANAATPREAGGKKKKNSGSNSEQNYQQQLQLQQQQAMSQQFGTYNIDSNSGVPLSSMRGGGGPSPINSTGTGRGRGSKAGGAGIVREPSPTLIPAIPEPLPPPSRSGGLYEEIAFFDKVKKFIGNKQSYNEFLKVINLFTQKIIDKNVLVERVDGFIGNNKELMDWFKRFVKYEGKPLHIENIVHKKHNLELSLCRSYGPSYRLLPKSETMMPCSGRDEMCWEVLNDEWVVHPTWASEDSGFVSHRKNQYEEILYRVEEERQEYDYYIGSNLRTIQTLETIANRIANLSNEEKTMFKLQPKLGTDSTIYQKIIRKIYDKEKGMEVIEALHENPAVAVPIVLRRLKQKDEEWKRAHREWNKVWRETEQKIFYKSLDHIGLTFKQTDKKLLTTRSLVSEITTVKAEQNSKRKNPALPLPKSQLLFKMSDNEVLLDIVRLVLCFLEHGGSYSSNDRERMETFFRSFLELFFSLPPNLISDRFPESEGNKSSSPEAGDEDSKSNGNAPASSSTPTSRKRAREPSGDLLRDVLKKSRFNGRTRDDDSSPAETPDPETDSAADSPVAINNGGDDEHESSNIPRFGDSEDAWLKHAQTSPSPELSIRNGNENQKREVFNLFSNTTIYVFVRILQILYDRLEEVKGYEDIVSKEIASSFSVDFANDLGLYDTKLADMGLRFDSKECYGQLLTLSERLIEGEVDHQWFEEAIRQAYRNRAYKFYTIDKIVQALVKHVHGIVGDQRSSDVLVLFQSDRVEPSSDIKKQIAYRMQVKKVIGPEESLFRIDWNNEEKQIGFQFLGNYDLTMRDIKKAEDKWNYYLTSYMMSVPTEGVPLDRIKAPLLYRSMIELVDENYPFVIIEQGLMARVCMNTYKLFFEAGTVDFFTRPTVDHSVLRTPAVIEGRRDRWTNFLEGSEGWKSGLEEKDIKNTEDRFQVWKEQGPEAFLKWQAPADEIEAKSEAVAEAGDETVTEGGTEAGTEAVTPKITATKPNENEGNSSAPVFDAMEVEEPKQVPMEVVQPAEDEPKDKTSSAAPETNPKEDAPEVLSLDSLSKVPIVAEGTACTDAPASSTTVQTTTSETKIEEESTVAATTGVPLASEEKTVTVPAVPAMPPKPSDQDGDIEMGE